MLRLFERRPPAPEVTEIEVSHAGELYRVALKRMASSRRYTLRVRAATDPHSPAKYRINGVLVNMPEFAKAFGCKAGQPMVRAADQVCKVW